MKNVIRLKKAVTLRFPKCGIGLSTYTSTNQSIGQGQTEWRRARIRMSARHVAKNVTYTGGFLGMLAFLAARTLPTILTGLTTGLLAGGINKAISGSGNGLYLQKHAKCYRVQKCKGDCLYLAPHPR